MNEKTNLNVPAELIEISEKLRKDLHFKDYEDLLRYLRYLAEHNALKNEDLEIVIL